MDDLFDVFDEQPQEGSANGAAHEPPTKKRRANGEVGGADRTNGNSTGKRQRHDEPITGSRNADMDDNGSGSGSDDASDNHPAAHQLAQEPEPRVADTFVSEQSREVAGSAGLQAQQEEQNVVLQHQVRHQVALPADYDYTPLSEHKPPADPARTWPFALDPFQQVSVTSIQRNESVLVSAHTSAGKTVVAEYAIAQCLKNNQRVIYTSPIKALSNQKYREFLAIFGDVGLLTGDVTINPEATCLVMTTEILRSMLYRGSEVMREVAWVVFDEVHYLRDKSRGVVWEETIILLPDKVRYVFLSATIPNAMQFAEWITKTHNQPCHVVYTDFRPTPLQHYLFPGGSDGIHLVVDEKGVFREDNFGRAMSSIADKRGDMSNDPNAKRKGRGKDKRMNKGGTKGPSDIYKIIKMILQKNYNPVIVFSFSKRECEALALQMSQLSFNDETEKDMVEKVFHGAIDTLSDEDKKLPQIDNILPLLRRGVGVHHSGLLPILKETIEILFQEGLLKALFATETFSIGLNMPAKTVVFTNVRKFDGVSVRWVSSSEFIQMSGRAGRRGIDDRGIVIMMIDERMEPSVAKEIVRGEQDKLNSAFHLSYNMILNLMRVEGISPEFMLERCFYQFQSIASVSGLEKQLHAVEAERSSINITDEATIKDYYDLRQSIDKYEKDMKKVITHPQYCLQYMQPGRLIRVRFEDHDFGWAVVVQHKKRNMAQHKRSALEPQEQYALDVCLLVAADLPKSSYRSPPLPAGVQPPGVGERAEMRMVEVLLTCVDQIGGVRLYMPDNLIQPKNLEKVQQNLEEVKKRFPDGMATLDPIENMGIKDDSFKKLIRKIEVLDSRLRTNPLHDSARLPELYNQYSKKVELQNQCKSLRKQITDALSIIQLEELKCRKRVLRRLGFINENDVVELKARAACEISTGDELVLSELLFNRFFNEQSPEQCAASLSCFVFEEKAEVKRLPDHLQKPLLEIQNQARIVAKVSVESKLQVKEDDYLATFNPGLMEVVYAWTKGATFAQICKMSSVYEGSLIRVFRRLEELLRQMGLAAKVIGNDDLFNKFEEALGMLRRDIVAAQSLYL